MLLDSNVIIYSIKPEFTKLRELIAAHNPVVSAISYVEVLGYHKLTAEDQRDFTEFFNATRVLPVSMNVVERAATLRQQRKMSLGDSVIAATAMIEGMALVTANISDFEWIKSLELLPPPLV